jgi:hypothetical protein
MPSSNRGWQNGWFYLQNDFGSLPKYTGLVVTERPEKWKWGAPSAEQPRLERLLEGLAKLRDEGLTEASVVATFHRWSVLPLA